METDQAGQQATTSAARYMRAMRERQRQKSEQERKDRLQALALIESLYGAAGATFGIMPELMMGTPAEQLSYIRESLLTFHATMVKLNSESKSPDELMKDALKGHVKKARAKK